MSKEIERRGIPTVMISAIYDLALSSGANRVVKGVRIENVVGDPTLGAEKDHNRGLAIVRKAVDTLATPISEPTVFEAPLGGPDDGDADSRGQH